MRGWRALSFEDSPRIACAVLACVQLGPAEVAPPRPNAALVCLVHHHPPCHHPVEEASGHHHSPGQPLVPSEAGGEEEEEGEHHSPGHFRLPYEAG